MSNRAEKVMPAIRERMPFCPMQISAAIAGISRGILVLQLARAERQRGIKTY